MGGRKAKYEEITDWIRARLNSGELKAGSRLESENQLVSIFSVSRQTVRHAISVLEHQGILERRRGSGTYIRLSSKKRTSNSYKTMRVAVMTTYVNEYIFSPIIEEMEKVLSEAEYSMQISFTNNSVEKERFILKGLLEHAEIDGVIAEPTKSALPNPNLDLYKRFKMLGIPVLFLNSYYEELDFPHISMNDKIAGKMATEHLLQCGHRKIAGIFKADDGQGKIRYSGYVEALMEADIRIKEKRIVWIDTEELRGTKEEFYRVLNRLEDCTACVCYNDEVANKLVGICLEQGLQIPGDISVVGIDNSNLAVYCEVPLTSMENPIRDLGRLAAVHIMKLINKESMGESLELEPKPVVRNSVRII